ncbi:hypothetical protein HPB48_000298 [Haemaphysalis longicornis]|uniref:BTB domain-containing protein n=1 Tax=Haemaphysalis longicornis TaxID=44386 RepID=A0A9J6G7F5_HAELO|nr:hypothetical protein HPB48_000298 [Haemaphysalis longicornis]
MAGIGEDAPSNMTTSDGEGTASQGKPFGPCCEQHAVETPANASPPMNRRGSDASQCLTTNGVRQRSDESLSSIASNSGQVLFNWQASKGTVQERLSFLFNKEILSDVRFLVGRGAQQQRLPAHKFVLSVGSAVFDAMFNGALATHAEEVELPDVEPAAFLALLRFLYSDQVQIGAETVMTTLYTAKKRAFSTSPSWPPSALDTIDKSTAEALAAEGFVDIDRDTLCAVLERDTLRIREVKLFAAALRWAEAECARTGRPANAENKRAALGRALFLVRFPLMSIEEFATGPAQSGLLTDRELVSLFLHLTVNPKPPVAFPESPRCCILGKEQVVARFQQTESRWGYSGTSDRIRFAVDRKIFVLGYGLYGSIHGPSDYDVNIQLVQTGTGQVLGSHDTSFNSDGSPARFRVLFKSPVEVAPNVNYTACATLKQGPDSHYGTKGLRKIALDCPRGSKVTFQFTYAAGNNNGTSVEDGQIPEIIFFT